MKTLTNYILEKLVINKNTKYQIDLIDEIKTIFKEYDIRFKAPRNEGRSLLYKPYNNNEKNYSEIINEFYNVINNNFKEIPFEFEDDGNNGRSFFKITNEKNIALCVPKPPNENQWNSIWFFGKNHNNYICYTSQGNIRYSKMDDNYVPICFNSIDNNTDLIKVYSLKENVVPEFLKILNNEI